MYTLLGVLAALMLPHAWHMPLWLVGAWVALVGWRAWLVRVEGALPPRWVLLPVVFMLIAGVFASYHTILGRNGGVALLSLLIAAKSLETRSRGDALVIVYLGYFLITTNFFFDQSMLMAAYLFVMVGLVTLLLIGWHSSNTVGIVRGALAQGRLAAVLMAQAIPVMVLLFIFFPRIEGPLWRLPQDRTAGHTGLSDSMSPGSFSSLTKDDTVAFRVSFQGVRPPQDKLYWRGPVFEDFDGINWAQAQHKDAGTPRVVKGAVAPVHYAMTIEPQAHEWLLALDMPLKTDADSRINDRMQLLSNKPLDKRTRFEVDSVIDYKMGVTERDEVLAHDVQLPDGHNPRARAMAARWAGLVPAERVNTALRFFATQNLQYTLEPPQYGADGIDDFLFGGRRGFCEHFASSFAFMMRAAGVPARVIGGYQGGDDNGDYLIVRQADAHAWTEVWLAGRGWVRVDPTFEVAPERIENGLGSAVPQEELPYLLRSDENWVKRARLMMDSMVNTWNQWVIGYTPERQRAVLRRLGILELASSQFVFWFGGILLTLVGGIAAWLLWRMRPPKPDPARLAWDRLVRKLARRGIEPGRSEGPRDFAARAAALLPQHAAMIDHVVSLYLAVRYGGDDTLQEFQQAVRALRV
jgi:transglutaminase-like putative cysteine protease